MHLLIQAKAVTLANGCKGDEEVAKKCFLFVRDDIRHTGDANENRDANEGNFSTLYAQALENVVQTLET